MWFWVLEAGEVVSIHHVFNLIDPLSLIQGEIKLILGLIIALFELEEDEEACEVVDDIVVGLVFLEMNAFHVFVFRSSVFCLHIYIFLSLLVLLSLCLRLILVTFCYGLLFALFLNLPFSFLLLFAVF